MKPRSRPCDWCLGDALYIDYHDTEWGVPCFDDLVFLGASMSRYPLEGYRERCDTNVTIGARNE